MLDEIVSNKKMEVEYLKKSFPLDEILGKLPDRSKSRNEFVNALLKSIDRGKPGLIAEIKFASPSKGAIRSSGTPEEIASIYESSEFVDCISVLTEKKYFNGHISYIERVKSVTSKPILRKDFIIDEYQIYESAYFGADAILLIVSCLTKEELERFLVLANKLGLDVLVELYSEEDIEKIDGLKVEMLGINSRNLKTLEVSLEHQSEILEKLKYRPKILVAESGIRTQEDILNAINRGFNAFLIGEAFMRAEDIGSKIFELMGNVRVFQSKA